MSNWWDAAPLVEEDEPATQTPPPPPLRLTIPAPPEEAAPLAAIPAATAPDASPGPSGDPAAPANWWEVAPLADRAPAERRSVARNLALGARAVGEGGVAGIGRTLQTLGAEDTGSWLAELGERWFGQTAEESERSAAIREANSLWLNVVDGAVQGGPSFGASIVAGLGGARAGAMMGGVIGGPKGAAVGGLVGGIVGSAMSIFPMMVNSAWNTAEGHGRDMDDFETRVGVLGTAIGTTAIQTIAPSYVSRALTTAFTRGGQQVARNALTSAARGVAIVGFTEGMAEASAIAIEQVIYDPQLRAALDDNDWRAIAPLMAELYGEDIVIAFGAGAFLGGGVGGVTGAVTARGPRPPEDTPDAPQPPAVEIGDVPADQAAALAATGSDTSGTGTAPGATQPTAPAGEAQGGVGTGDVAADQAAALGASQPRQSAADITRSFLDGLVAPEAPAQGAGTPPVTPPGNASQQAQAPAQTAPQRPPTQSVWGEDVMGFQQTNPEQSPARSPVQNTAEQAGDTLGTVPEAPATLAQQAADLSDRTNARVAMFIPRSSLAAGDAPRPTGPNIRMARLPDGAGILYWDFKKTNGLTVRDALAEYADGNLGELLGLGPFTKADVLASVAEGNAPLAVTERTPDGVEVKAAAGTQETVAEQVAAIEADAAPGNTVQVEDPAAVLAGRMAAQDATQDPAASEAGDTLTEAAQAAQSTQQGGLRDDQTTDVQTAAAQTTDARGDDAQGVRGTLRGGETLGGGQGTGQQSGRFDVIGTYGSAARPVTEIDNPGAFREIISEVKAVLGELGAQVTVYDDYTGMRLFLMDGGHSGFALNGDDIISVFNHPDAPRNAVKEMFPVAVALGGRRLDGFNTFLPKIYERAGFRAVAKTPFSRKHAPDGWDYDFFQKDMGNSDPDIVFMVYDPQNATRDTDNIVPEYDDGTAAQIAALQTIADRAAPAPLVTPEVTPAPTKADAAKATSKARGKHGGARDRRRTAQAAREEGQRLESRNEGYDSVNERVKAGGLNHVQEAEARLAVAGRSRSRSKDKLEAARVAGKIFDNNVPGEMQLVPEGDRAGKAALRDRLARAADEGTEAKFPFTDRPNFPVNANAVVWLNHARMMLGKLRGDKASYAEIQQFLMDEHAMKTANNGDLLRATRKETGTKIKGSNAGYSGTAEGVADPSIGAVIGGDRADPDALGETDSILSANEGEADAATGESYFADTDDLGARVVASRRAPRINVTEGAASEARSLKGSAEFDTKAAEALARYGAKAPPPKPKPASKAEAAKQASQRRAPVENSRQKEIAEQRKAEIAAATQKRGEQVTTERETARERAARELAEAKAWLQQNDAAVRGEVTPEVTPEGAAGGTVTVYRGQRTDNDSGDGVGEAAFGIGRYWSAAQDLAARYKDIVVPVKLSGPKGETTLNKRDALADRTKLNAALREIGLTANQREAVVRHVAGEPDATLPDGVTVEIGGSEIATTDIDTSRYVRQTGKARYNEYDLNNTADVQALKGQGIEGTIYTENGITNYVEFPAQLRPTSPVRESLKRKGAKDYDGPTLLEVLDDSSIPKARREFIARVVNVLQGRSYSKMSRKDRIEVHRQLGLAVDADLEVHLAKETHRAGDVAQRNEVSMELDLDRVRAYFGEFGDIVARVVPRLGARLSELVGNTKVYVLEDSVFDVLSRGAQAYYTPADKIIMRESDLSNGELQNNTSGETLVHEMAHAAFSSAIANNRRLTRVIDTLRDIVRPTAKEAGFGDNYWDYNAHEFVSEMFGNPDFIALLADTPITKAELERLNTAGLGGSKGVVKTVFDAIKRMVADVLGINDILTQLGYTGNQRTAFEVGMSIAEELVKFSPVARALYGLDTGQIREANRKGKPRELRDPVAKKLHDLGVSPRVAAMAAEAIKNDARLTSGVTDAQLAALADLLKKSAEATSTEQRSLTAKQKALAAKYDKQRSVAMSQAAKMEAETGTALKADFVPGKKVKNPTLLKLASNFQIADTAKRFFGDKNPVHIISRLIEERRLTKQRISREAGGIVKELGAAERRHTKAQWKEFGNFLADVTMAQGHPDVALDHASNKHIQKTGMRDAWKRKQHAENARRYEALPQDLKDLYAKTRDTLAELQNRMSLKLMENVLTAVGVTDMSIAQRLHDGADTQADRDLLGPVIMGHMENVAELKKLKGPYFNLARRGNWVVHGTYEVTAPAGATKVGENRVEFIDEKAAEAYSENLDQHNSVQTVYVDKKTGKRYGVEADGTEVRISKDDTDAVARYVVTVQNRHVEFLDSRREAVQRRALLANDPTLKLADVEPRTNEQSRQGAQMMSDQMRQMMATIDKRPDLSGLSPAQTSELKATLNEVSLRFLGSTRIQSSRLPRRHVEGSSRDIARNTLDYVDSTSGYLARLETGPRLTEALKDLDRRVRDISSRGTGSGEGAKMIQNEIVSRVEDAEHSGESWFTRQVDRLVAASFVNYLASPAYSMINSMQVGMLGLPALAGQFNLASAQWNLMKAYKDVGALQMVGGGVVDTVRAVGGKEVFGARFVENVKKRLNDGERRMIDSLVKEGLIDAEAGLEVARTLKRKGLSGTIVDTPLGYLENVTRGLPQAIEAMNRTVMSVASYRMHLKKFGDHDKAVAFASEMTHDSQGLYSNSNAAPMFTHPVGRVALQFLKYPQLVYFMYGKNVGKILSPLSKGERMKGIKTIATLTATHALVAGMAGAFLYEAFKIPLMIFRGMGLTDLSWEDFEGEVEKALEELTGSDRIAQVLMRGVPTAAGFDISARTGLQNTLFFGEPRTNDQQGWKAFLFDFASGAGGGMGVDIVRGISALSEGNIGRAMESLLPMKVMADTARGLNHYRAGRYNEQEFAIRAFGLMPERAARVSREIGSEIRASRQTRDQRTSLENAYRNATRQQDIARAASAIRSYNAGLEQGARPISINALMGQRQRNDARWRDAAR